MKKKILICFLITTIVFVCGFTLNINSGELLNSESEEYYTLVNEKYGFGLDVPVKWLNYFEMKDDYMGGDAGYLCFTGESYVSKRFDMPTFFVLLGSYKDLVPTPESHYDSLEHLGTSSSGVEIYCSGGGMNWVLLSRDEFPDLAAIFTEQELEKMDRDLERFKQLREEIPSILKTFKPVDVPRSTQKIDVMYRNIKIMSNGQEFVPKNVNGYALEPFIHEGSTYIPLRSFAEFYGKDVTWDDEKNIINIK